jgi:hypothetical protein
MGTRNSLAARFFKMDIAYIDCFLAGDRGPKLKGGALFPIGLRQTEQ